MEDKNYNLKKIPSVNLLLEKLNAQFPQIKPIYLKRIILFELDYIREKPQRFQLNKIDKAGFQQKLIERITEQIELLLEGTLKPVINATGVVLHTGLGRAPINPALTQKAAGIGRYTNLEIKLENGKRGERTDHIAPLLRILSGAEDGLAVNNNAAAVMLMLNTIGRRKEIILSRGEMVEIGGSFRLPEVMKISGCKLKEIGTTNKTHIKDYQQAVSKKTAAILICHTSNYEIKGFTYRPELNEIVELAHGSNLPVIFDLGSGSLEESEKFGSNPEPLVSDIVEAGVDLISFSGDKLLGGPQAGIIVGKEKWVQKCAKNHLLRALRLDKFILKMLQETLISYLYGGQVFERLDSLNALTKNTEELKKRSELFLHTLPEELQIQMEIVESTGKVGSGAYPTLELPSWAVKVTPKSMRAERLGKKLRNCSRPVFSYIDNEALFIDLRTVNNEEEKDLKKALIEILR